MEISRHSKVYVSMREKEHTLMSARFLVLKSKLHCNIQVVISIMMIKLDKFCYIRQASNLPSLEVISAFNSDNNTSVQ